MYKHVSYKEVAKNLNLESLDFVCYYAVKIVKANISH